MPTEYAEYPPEDLFLDPFFHLFPEGLAWVDPSGIVRKVNSRLEEWLRQPSADLVGKAIGVVFPQVPFPPEEPLRDQIFHRESPEALDQWFSCTWVAPGSNRPYLLVVRDLSPLKFAEERLTRTLEGAGLVAWELDFTSLTLRLDGRLWQLLGVDIEPPQNRIALDAFLDRFTVGGKSSNGFLLAILRIAHSTRPDYEEQVHLPLRTTEGNVLPAWFKLQGRMGQGSQIDQAFGTIRTRPEPFEEPVANISHGQWDRLAAAAGLALFRIEPEGLVLEATPSFNRWLGYSVEHSLTWGEFAQNHLGPTQAIGFSQALSSLGGEGFERRELPLRIRIREGQIVSARCWLQKASGPTPWVEGILQAFSEDTSDISANPDTENLLAEANTLVETLRLSRMVVTDEQVFLEGDIVQALGIVLPELPYADFVETHVVGRAELLDRWLAEAQPGMPRRISLRATTGQIQAWLLWQMQDSAPDSTLDHHLVLAPFPDVPSADSGDRPEEGLGSGLGERLGVMQRVPEVLLDDRQETPGELPEQIHRLFEQVAKETEGVRVSLWLMDPSGLSSYAVYPEPSVAVGLLPSALPALFEELRKGRMVLRTEESFPESVTTGFYGLAVPLVREGLLLGYVWAQASGPDILIRDALLLVGLALRSTLLLEREAVRDTATLQDESAAERQAILREVEDLRAERAQLRSGLAQLNQVFLRELPAAVAGKALAGALVELPVALERLQQTQVELLSCLEQLLEEMPGLLRHLPDIEAQLGWDLLRRSLIHHAMTPISAASELFPPLEMELTGLGVPQVSLQAEALAQLGWSEGLGPYGVLLKHPDAPVLLAKLARFHPIRSALLRTAQLIDRLGQRAATLIWLQPALTSESTDPRAVQLSELVEGLLPAVGVVARGILRVERVYEARPVVWASMGPLVTLLLQLLEGRLTRLGTGQHVRLVVGLQEGMAEIRLTDTGPVLPLELQQLLAMDATEDPGFFSLSALRHAQYLARTLGGKLHASSIREQTQLRLKLPLAPSVDTPAV